MTKIIVPSVADIRQFLKDTPSTAVKSWLRSNGKPHSASNQADFYKKLNKWLKDGDITLQDLTNAVLDVEESGGKKVYLKVLKGDFPQTKAEFDSFLAGKKIAIAARSPRSLKNSFQPVLNHILWEETINTNHIIIKYSELQEDVETDVESESFVTVDKPVFFVIKIDVKTGFTEFRFDSPARRHAHKGADGKSNITVLENFYFDRIEYFFPGTKMELFGLVSISDYIVQHCSDTFRLNREEATTSGNGKQTYASAGDVRQLAARIGAAKADGDNWVINDITGTWIAQKSNGALLNDIFMRLSKEDSSLKFHRDCLTRELNYAIATIREIKKKI